jgi:uncharacterized protein YndB with AHSA1/START domain
MPLNEKANRSTIACLRIAKFRILFRTSYEGKENSMANPLKLLKLKVTGFQFIQELPIDAPPKKVWAALLNVGKWFTMTPDGSPPPKNVLEAWPGGRWYSEAKDGTQSLNAIVTRIEPGKLLRLSGPIGLTHLPVNNVNIFELQPKNSGKTTLLRVGQRTFGFLDADVEEKYAGGWGQLLQILKKNAEK